MARTIGMSSAHGSARCSETEYDDGRSQCSLPHLQSTASNRGSTVGARGSDISDTFLGAAGNPSSRHELESVESLAAFQKASSITGSAAGGATSAGGSGPEGLVQCNSGPFSGRSCLMVAERTGAARRTLKPASHTVETPLGVGVQRARI